MQGGGGGQHPILQVLKRHAHSRGEDLYPICPAAQPLPPSRPPCNPSCPAPGQAHPCCSPGQLGRTLVWLRNGLWYQVGIVSWGVGCGRPNWHGVYTNISRYFNWIRMLMVRSGLPRPEPCPLLLLALLCAPPSPAAGPSPTGPLSIGPVPLCPVSTKPFCVFIEKKCCVLTPCRAFCGPRGLPGHPHSHPCPPGAHP